MPKSDLEPIISSIQQMLNINEPESTSKSPSSSGVDAEKRIKKLQKKLSSIEELKERQAKGESLEQSQVCLFSWLIFIIYLHLGCMMTQLWKK